MRLALLALVLLATCTTGPTMTEPYADPTTTWRVTELNGAPFAAEATLSFPEVGRIAGKAVCNAFNGPMTASWPDFAVGPLASTRMACPGLDQEAAMFAALDAATGAALDGTSLVLSGPSGEVMRLKPAG